MKETLQKFIWLILTKLVSLWWRMGHRRNITRQKVAVKNLILSEYHRNSTSLPDSNTKSAPSYYIFHWCSWQTTHSSHYWTGTMMCAVIQAIKFLSPHDACSCCSLHCSLATRDIDGWMCCCVASVLLLT